MLNLVRNLYRRFFRPLHIIFKNTVSFYAQDRLRHIGAAMAYYTIFSLPAILIIIIALVGFFFGEAAVEGRIYSTLVDYIGQDSAMQIQNAVQNIGSNSTNWLMTVIGIGFLLFIATNIFYTMQETLNLIFGVQEVPQKVKFVQAIINRVLSFGMILSIGGLLVLSILVNGLLFALTQYIYANQQWLLEHLPESWAPAINFLSDNFLVLLNLAVSIFLIAVFFVLLYQILPAVVLRWRHIWSGAIFVAILFWLGQLLIAYYLSKAGVISAYGAAGSLIAILIWVYYSAQLIFIGAEFIRALCLFRGVAIQPKAFAKQLRTGKKRTVKMRRKNENGEVIDVYKTPLAQF